MALHQSILTLPGVYSYLYLCSLGTTALQAQTKGMSHLLSQQFVPECTVDDREYLQFSAPSEYRTQFGKYKDY
jgi:hypothetical protein